MEKNAQLGLATDAQFDFEAQRSVELFWHHLELFINEGHVHQQCQQPNGCTINWQLCFFSTWEEEEGANFVRELGGFTNCPGCDHLVEPKNQTKAIYTLERSSTDGYIFCKADVCKQDTEDVAAMMGSRMAVKRKSDLVVTKQNGDQEFIFFMRIAYPCKQCSTDIKKMVDAWNETTLPSYQATTTYLSTILPNPVALIVQHYVFAYVTPSCWMHKPRPGAANGRSPPDAFL